MSRVIESTIFTFPELSDRAKEKAREWYREGNLSDEWWEDVYDDAATVADKLGIDLRQKPARLMNGKTVYNPAIYFSGFCSQGDGACFEGRYRYRKGAAKDVAEYAPQDSELQRIANELQAIQRRNFYGVTASVAHTGRYCHERSTSIDVDFGERAYSQATADEVAELLRDFMRWIYRQLETEHDWLNSDEVIDENMEANGYEFDESGSPA